MATPPGSAGFPIFGDKSLEFYKDPIGFVQRQIDHHKSRLFYTRFLNQPSVFVCSHSGVRELFNDESSSFHMGYKQFMENIYGDNIIFSDGDEAQQIRTALQKILMSQDSIHNFQAITDRLTERTVSTLPHGVPVVVYNMIKKLSTEICLSVFLDEKFESSSKTADEIIGLTTTHWHGIISVPINLKLPISNSKSTYGKAMDAKKRLQEIIKEKLKEPSDGFPGKMKDGSFPCDDLMINHILLFTSALVPKAIASILASFILVTAQKPLLRAECRACGCVLERVLLEVQRMWPPFIGGRRVAVKDCVVDGTLIKKGQAVIFMTHHAQRDPQAFPEPDTFEPNRWQHMSGGTRDKLLLFGGGSRSCLGQHLTDPLLKKIASELLQKFEWQLSANQDVAYKWLPVSRPHNDVSVIFTPCVPLETSNSISKDSSDGNESS